MQDSLLYCFKHELVELERRQMKPIVLDKSTFYLPGSRRSVSCNSKFHIQHNNISLRPQNPALDVNNRSYSLQPALCVSSLGDTPYSTIFFENIHELEQVYQSAQQR